MPVGRTGMAAGGITDRMWVRITQRPAHPVPGDGARGVMVSSSLTSGVVVTGSGGWVMLARLTVPFLALTALATSILWFREHRTMARG